MNDTEDKNYIEQTLKYRPPFTVKLTYFKKSGKYYSDGTYKTDKLHLWEIWDEVRSMNENGGLPDLAETSKGWIISVKVKHHPFRHPHLIVPKL